MFQEMFNDVIKTIVAIFTGFLLLRFWMQALKLRAPFSIGQSIFKLTDWFVKPLRRIIPGYAGYDWASLSAAYLAAVLLNCIEAVFTPNFNWMFILVFALIHLVQWILNGFMILLAIEVVFSFLNPHAPLAPLVSALNLPLLSPFRKILPPVGGFDFSVLIVFLILQLLSRMINNSMPYFLF